MSEIPTCIKTATLENLRHKRKRTGKQEIRYWNNHIEKVICGKREAFKKFLSAGKTEQTKGQHQKEILVETLKIAGNLWSQEGEL
jgi:hypothetical protein